MTSRSLRLTLNRICCQACHSISLAAKRLFSRFVPILAPPKEFCSGELRERAWW